MYWQLECTVKDMHTVLFYDKFSYTVAPVLSWSLKHPLIDRESSRLLTQAWVLTLVLCYASTCAAATNTILPSPAEQIKARKSVIAFDLPEYHFQNKWKFCRPTRSTAFFLNEIASCLCRRDNRSLSIEGIGLFPINIECSNAERSLDGTCI